MKGIICKKDVIKYDGLSFYKQKSGYYIAKGNCLHLYIWKKYIGPIPKGYQIHHMDKDKDNNDLFNFCCLTKSDHMLYHKLTISNETRRKISDANKGKKTWITGKHHTKETKKKISEAGLGRAVPEYVREKTRIRMMGNTYGKGKQKESTKLKISKTKTVYKDGDIWRNRGGDLYTKENNKIRKLKVSEIKELRRII